MSSRALERETAASTRQVRRREPVSCSPAAQQVLALQRSAGNRAVASMLIHRRCGRFDCTCTHEEEDDFQRHAASPSNGRVVQRLVDPQQLTAGIGAVEEAPTPTDTSPGLLELGSRGKAVANLQRMLDALGFGPLADDGVFGPLTEAAVQAFQAENGLEPDGIVGPKTTEALFGAVSGPQPLPDERAPIKLEVPANLDAPGPGARSLNDICAYRPGEKKRTADDPGDGFSASRLVTDPVLGIPIEEPGDRFGIFGFTQGDFTVKPAQHEHLRKMVERFELGGASPKRKVRLIEGFTDCVDAFDKNISIRRERAIATRNALKELGVDEQNLGDAVAAQSILELEEFSADPEVGERGRRRNRAAVCHVELVPAPKPEDGQHPPIDDRSCDRISSDWRFKSVAKTAIGKPIRGIPVGAVVVDFNVTNKKTGCVHEAAFFSAGFVTPGGVLKVPIFLGGAVTDPVHVIDDVHADELEGFGELHFLGATPLPGTPGTIVVTPAEIRMASGPIINPIKVGSAKVKAPFFAEGAFVVGFLFVSRSGKAP